jgi:glutamyl-tRNA reductase
MVPVESLEQATLRAHRISSDWADAMQEDATIHPWLELAVLATCNRVELWVTARGDGTAAADVLFEALGVSDGPGGHELWYEFRGEDAVRHLCRVAAGLDSMVLGEPQIAGQVARALRATATRPGTPPVLHNTARIASRASRRAREETGISRGPASVSSLAVEMAVDEAGGLANKHVVVVGAGKMGRLACAALATARQPGTRITVVNRTLDRAQALADRIAAEAAGLDQLPALLSDADVVLASTAAPEPLVDAAMLASVRDTASSRPLVLVDIALPRNVDASVRTLDNVHLYGIEDLRSRLATRLDERARHVPDVERIVEEEVAAWAHADEVSPVLAALYRNAERLRRRETSRALSGLAGADEHVIAHFEQLSRTLVRKLLHEPAQRLRGETEPERRRAYARATEALFGLDAPTGDRPT